MALTRDSELTLIGLTTMATLSIYNGVKTIIKDKGLERNSQVLNVVRILFLEYASTVNETGERGQQIEMVTQIKQQIKTET